MIWTTSSCLWRAKDANRPDFWKALRAGEDFVYEFLMGVKNIKVGKTPSNSPLVYKRSHPESLSSNIYNDMNDLFDSNQDLMRNAQFYHYRFYLPMILNKIDQASMFNSVESRSPFLSKKIIKTYGYPN